MDQTKKPANVQYLQAEDGSDLLSHYRITKNKYGQQVAVPVIDVRDGASFRMMAYQMIAATNRSKYMNYNQYHQSRKQYKNI